MADRKAEIDLKRKKLEELRKSREQKKSETANKALLTRGSPSSRTKSPDPLSKERDDVNKLVSDLIGGSPPATKPSSTPSVLAKSPGEVAASPAAGTPAPACKRKTKLVMEALAPVVIRPKVVHWE
jgi:dynein intermediate chain